MKKCEEVCLHVVKLGFMEQEGQPTMPTANAQFSPEAEAKFQEYLNTEKIKESQFPLCIEQCHKRGKEEELDCMMKSRSHSAAKACEHPGGGCM